MNLILCGMPKSGKSTLGSLLAEKLKWDFIDSDRLIELEHARLTNEKSVCREIYSRRGVLYFRQLEKRLIESLKQSQRCVIALGGGSLMDQEILQVVLSLGSLVYLNVSEAILWKRIEKKGIPASLDRDDPERSFGQIYQKRIPIFKSNATFILETCEMNEEQLVNILMSYKERVYGC